MAVFGGLGENPLPYRYIGGRNVASVFHTWGWIIDKRLRAGWVVGENIAEQVWKSTDSA